MTPPWRADHARMLALLRRQPGTVVTRCGDPDGGANVTVPHRFDLMACVDLLNGECRPAERYVLGGGTALAQLRENPAIPGLYLRRPRVTGTVPFLPESWGAAVGAVVRDGDPGALLTAERLRRLVALAAYDPARLVLLRDVQTLGGWAAVLAVVAADRRAWWA